MSKTYEIRCPIHGFIELDEWEMEMVNHPAFQRLRRIRQLGLSELVYPGTTHTRFEHSLGVMHVGTRMFDQICKKHQDAFLKNELKFNNDDLKRDRKIVRLACLLHDVGHSPFSHAGEEIMPKNEKGKCYRHEDYSCAIIRHIFHEIIDDRHDGITADDVADMVEGDVSLGKKRLWHDIVSSQLDADRADYLLRDSYHAGVTYGHYDLERIIVTLTVGYGGDDGDTPVIAIDKSGAHSAEALIIARYMMFWQVYFQKTRRICDKHITEALQLLLKKCDRFPDDVFLSPTSKENVDEYLKWDDYRVFGEMHANKCGRHGKCIFERKLDKCVFETLENKDVNDLEFLGTVRHELRDNISWIDRPSFTWYKNKGDVPIFEKNKNKIVSLSSFSQIITALKEDSQPRRIYVPMELYDQSIKTIDELKNH